MAIPFRRSASADFPLLLSFLLSISLSLFSSLSSLTQSRGHASHLLPALPLPSPAAAVVSSQPSPAAAASAAAPTVACCCFFCRCPCRRLLLLLPLPLPSPLACCCFFCRCPCRRLRAAAVPSQPSFAAACRGAAQPAAQRLNLLRCSTARLFPHCKSEALGVAAGMSSGAMLPGPAIPILNQTFLVWQLAFSTLLLGRRYSLNRISGCLLVASGVIVAVASGSDTGQILSGIGFVWPALMIASSASQAGASILKESVFIDAAARLKGKLLDIFVVNSFGSGFQALFVFLFLPFLSNLKGIPFSQLPLYLKSGAGCFFNIAGNAPGCDGAPLLPLLYIITNIAFNISLLNLVKISSAVVSSLAAMSSVPLSIYILSLPLPYLPEGVNLSSFFLFGNVILVIGLILYNIPQPLKQDSEIM